MRILELLGIFIPKTNMYFFMFIAKHQSMSKLVEASQNNITISTPILNQSFKFNFSPVSNKSKLSSDSTSSYRSSSISTSSTSTSGSSSSSHRANSFDFDLDIDFSELLAQKVAATPKVVSVVSHHNHHNLLFDAANNLEGNNKSLKSAKNSCSATDDDDVEDLNQLLNSTATATFASLGSMDLDKIMSF
jgi:hypothetical protein